MSPFSCSRIFACITIVMFHTVFPFVCIIMNKFCAHASIKNCVGHTIYIIENIMPFAFVFLWNFSLPKAREKFDGV